MKRLFVGLMALMMLVGQGNALQNQSMEVKFAKGSVCSVQYEGSSDTFPEVLVMGLNAGQYIYAYWNELSDNGAGGFDVNPGEMVLWNDANRQVELFGTFGNVYVFKVRKTADYYLAYQRRPGYVPNAYGVKICAYNTMQGDPLGAMAN